MIKILPNLTNKISQNCECDYVYRFDWCDF